MKIYKAAIIGLGPSGLAVNKLIYENKNNEIIAFENTNIDKINKSDIKKSIKIAEKLIKGHGRILVRKSGTESKIRVMGESENVDLLEKCINISKQI